MKYAFFVRARTANTAEFAGWIDHSGPFDEGTTVALRMPWRDTAQYMGVAEFQLQNAPFTGATFFFAACDVDDYPDLMRSVRMAEEKRVDERTRDIESYLRAAADGSVYRNNSEQLAAELLERIREP